MEVERRHHGAAPSILVDCSVGIRQTDLAKGERGENGEDYTTRIFGRGAAEESPRSEPFKSHSPDPVPAPFAGIPAIQNPIFPLPPQSPATKVGLDGSLGSGRRWKAGWRTRTRRTRWGRQSGGSGSFGKEG